MAEFRGRIHDDIAIDDDAAFAMARACASREGIPVGISPGAAWRVGARPEMVDKAIAVILAYRMTDFGYKPAVPAVVELRPLSTPKQTSRHPISAYRRKADVICRHQIRLLMTQAV